MTIYPAAFIPPAFADTRINLHRENICAAVIHEAREVENDNMAIIDCLMNLPLLYWATLETGNKKYHDIAVRHADMVLKYFVRRDDTVCHAFRFDLHTGQPIGPDN